LNKELTEETSKYQLDGYSIGGLIGRGSVGSVYEATDKNGRKVAIKFMDITPFLDDAFIGTIVEGVISIRKKVNDHAHLVEVFETGHEGNYYYIVMELCYDGTLEKCIESPNYSISDKLDLVITIGASLSLVHSVGIVHADLKPSNILLHDNIPHLNDFYQVSGPNQDFLGTHLQGTPRYMSPEQADGKFITSATDIYSFGVLCYEVMTGQSPYGSGTDNIPSMVNAIIKGDIISPYEACSRLNSSLGSVILKALELKVEDRYKSISDMVADLKACRDKKSISIPVYKKSFKEMIMGFFHR
jgi:eukaryotic-like serine/threonine-protein kinase